MDEKPTNFGTSNNVEGASKDEQETVWAKKRRAGSVISGIQPLWQFGSIYASKFWHFTGIIYLTIAK